MTRSVSKPIAGYRRGEDPGGFPGPQAEHPTESRWCTWTAPPTAQKPFAGDRAIRRFHEVDCANIHRGVHELSQRSTAAYEETRSKVRRFLNAKSKEELIFVRGTTEGINLVASSWGRRNVKAGDEVIISAMEHHSNIVPWQMLCEETGATLRVIPMNDRGELLMEEYASC